jgi:hypothetical protein
VDSNPVDSNPAGNSQTRLSTKTKTGRSNRVLVSFQRGVSSPAGNSQGVSSPVP